MTHPIQVGRSLTQEQLNTLLIVGRNRTTARVISDAEYRELSGLGLVIRTNGRADRLTDLGKAVCERIVKRKRPAP